MKSNTAINRQRRQLQKSIAAMRRKLRALGGQETTPTKPTRRERAAKKEREAHKRRFIVSAKLLDQVAALWLPHYPTMPYEDYLVTPYWTLLREALFIRRGKKCQTCAAPLDRFHLHHTSYEFRGREHLAINTLRVLCWKCHRLEHPDKAH